MKARAVHHVGHGKVAVQDVPVNRAGPGQVLMKAECSAISAGTESLIFRGEFPTELALDASIPHLQRGFGYPLAYGYALVGRVVEVGSTDDEAWLGRRVLAFHPHQDYACVGIDQCLSVPDGIGPHDAVFLPNAESALNFVMDAKPLVGECFLVMGQGTLGLLTTAILASFPLAGLVVVDRAASRRARAALFGATAVAALDHYEADGEPAGQGFDAAIELSGNPAALDEVIEKTAFGGRIVIGSWYGVKTHALHLGGVFHRRRLQLYSSQVSTLAPDLSARWNKARRIALAWDWIRRIGPAALVTHAFPPDRCQDAFELAADPNQGALQIVFDY